MKIKTPIELENLVMAHRYLYYVKNESVISDYNYDMMEKKTLKIVGNNSPLHKTGSSNKEDYSQSIIMLSEQL